MILALMPIIEQLLDIESRRQVQKLSIKLNLVAIIGQNVAIRDGNAQIACNLPVSMPQLNHHPPCLGHWYR